MHFGAKSLLLTRLTTGLGPAYLEMVDEFEAAGEGYPYNNIPLAREDWAAFIRELDEEEQGIGLPGVVLTVEGKNEPSVRMIQGQGGRLERREVDPESGESVALYWIPLQ